MWAAYGIVYEAVNNFIINNTLIYRPKIMGFTTDHWLPCAQSFTVQLYAQQASRVIAFVELRSQICAKRVIYSGSMNYS